MQHFAGHDGAVTAAGSAAVLPFSRRGLPLGCTRARTEMTTRSAVLRRVATGALVMVVLGVASSMIDPRPHQAPLTYYVRLIDLAALLGCGVYVYRTPCARCGKPIGWRGLDRTAGFNCPHCGAASGSEFPGR